MVIEIRRSDDEVGLYEEAPTIAAVFHKDSMIEKDTYRIFLRSLGEAICKTQLSLIDRITNRTQDFIHHPLTWIPCYLMLCKEKGGMPRQHLIFLRNCARFSPMQNAIYYIDIPRPVSAHVTFATAEMAEDQAIELLKKDIDWDGDEERGLAGAGLPLRAPLVNVIRGPAARDISQDIILEGAAVFKKYVRNWTNFYNTELLPLYGASSAFSILPWNRDVFLINGPLIGQGTYKVVVLTYKVRIITDREFIVKHRAIKRPKGSCVSIISFLSDKIREIDSSYFDVPKPSKVRIQQRPVKDGGHCRIYLSKLGIDLDRGTNQISSGNECKKIVYQLLSGLHAAHTKGCLHRDLKPANWILYRNPPKYSFKARIEDTDSSGPIEKAIQNEIPYQSPYLHSLVLRKKLIEIGFICNGSLSIKEYKETWYRSGIAYRESFVTERVTMGFALAELYLNFMRVSREREPQINLEEAILGLCSFSVRKEDGNLFCNFNAFLDYVNEEVGRMSMAEVETRENSSIELWQALGLLL